MMTISRVAAALPICLVSFALLACATDEVPTPSPEEQLAIEIAEDEACGLESEPAEAGKELALMLWQAESGCALVAGDERSSVAAEVPPCNQCRLDRDACVDAARQSCEGTYGAGTVGFGVCMNHQVQGPGGCNDVANACLEANDCDPEFPEITACKDCDNLHRMCRIGVAQQCGNDCKCRKQGYAACDADRDACRSQHCR